MKEIPIQLNNAYHHVIMPVYIPHLEGYFTHSFEVLQLCLSSLLGTVHKRTAITIVDNASCREVKEYLRSLVDSRFIYSLITYEENQGKVNPLISVMKGCREALITISDADVLFKPGWQQEVEKVFVHFPAAGFVSPLPQPGLAYYFSQWSWFMGLPGAVLGV